MLGKEKMGLTAGSGSAKAKGDVGQGGNGVQTFGDKEGMERNQVTAPAEKPAVIKTDD